MKELTYEHLKTNYPMIFDKFAIMDELWEDYEVGLSREVVHLALPLFGSGGFACKEEQSISKFKESLSELKAKYEKEFLRFLEEFGIENGGRWQYYEDVEIQKDGTVNSTSVIGFLKLQQK